MTTMEQLLESKGRDIFSITPDDSVYLAIERMSEKGVGALVVLENGRLVGMISERDYARKVILQGRSSRQTCVGDIMTTDVICVRPTSTVDECMALLTEKHIRHLPVMQGGKLTGIVSIGDLVKEILSEKDFTIRQLQSYICS
jgi:CBS domain-containing protein